MLNLDLEKVTFVKNEDNTYTVYQRISHDGILKLPRCRIEVNAEALEDANGEIFQWIDCSTTDTYKGATSKTGILLRKIKRFFRVRR